MDMQHKLTVNGRRACPVANVGIPCKSMPTCDFPEFCHDILENMPGTHTCCTEDLHNCRLVEIPEVRRLVEKQNYIPSSVEFRKYELAILNYYKQIPAQPSIYKTIIEVAVAV